MALIIFKLSKQLRFIIFSLLINEKFLVKFVMIQHKFIIFQRNTFESILTIEYIHINKYLNTHVYFHSTFCLNK
jgi:hypothetical protein